MCSSYWDTREMIEKLPRREREILEILYSLKEASAADVRARLQVPLSDSATRALLSRLEAKKLVKHRMEQLRYVYAPVRPEKAAGQNALRKLVRTFFSDSPVKAATALIGLKAEFTDEELKELQNAISKARRDSR